MPDYSSTISRLGVILNEYSVSMADMPRALTRYLGGWQRENYPYINGYWQLLIRLPDALFVNIAGIDKYWAQRWILSTAEGFTPPSRNLNKVDLPGQGGIGSSYVSGQTLNRTFTTTHREYSKLIMLKLLGIWTNVIDSLVGVSELRGDEWIPKSYKGLAYVFLTKPTGAGRDRLTEDDIEEVFIFDGVWPETYPIDALNQDIATNDSVVLSVTWSFDGWPISSEYEGIAGNAIALLNNLAAGGYVTHFANIINSISNSSQTATP
ncbi:MAG: hypothetical protein QXD03_01760 [Candidatus Anstonellales archaeon]